MRSEDSPDNEKNLHLTVIIKFMLIINFAIKMATETERKFLVRGEFRHLAVKEISITQAYLLKDPHKTIRLRIADDKAFLTIKTPLTSESIARNEWEFQIPVEDASADYEDLYPG